MVAALTQRPVFAVATVGLFTFLFTVALWSWRIPVPSNVDEFANLLTADTFTHFRLTNPTHPLWVHFETINVFHTPHYASKFPPLPGATMALGKVLFGRPIVGVWLSTALACAAVSWMLMGCMPRKWAMLGGVLAAFHPIVLLWNQHYFAANLGVLGSALMVGSVLRIVRAPKPCDGVLLALGVAVVANSRPYECFALVVICLAWIFLQGRSKPLREALLPAACGLLLVAATMGYYNWRVTGDATKLPYQVYEAQYDIASPFWLLPARPAPVYRHASLQAFHGWEYACWEVQHEHFDPAVVGTKLLSLRCYPWSMPGLSLCMVVGAVRKRVVLLALAGLVAFVCAELLAVWLNPNYTTPAAPLFFLVTTECLRYLNQLRLPKLGRIGPGLVAVVVLLSATGAILGWQPIAIDDSRYGVARAAILRDLSKLPNKQLVIVQYPPQHNFFAEWVYNEADIDAARVVWAQDMGPQNQELIEYYRDRTVRFLQANE